MSCNGKFLNLGIKTFTILLLSTMLPHLAPDNVSASVIESDLKLMPVASFGGTLDSIQLPPSYGENLQTGPITLSLDPSANNVFGLDDVLHSGKIDVTLMLSSPLFTALGQTPLIHIVEVGPAAVQFPNPEEPNHFLFHSDLTGGGTVANGLFAGTVWSNLNAYDGEGNLGSWDVQPGSIVNWNVQNGSVTFPEGTMVTGVGGIGTATIAPEPSSLALAAAGVVGLLAQALRKRREILRWAY
jgi:hypothetical protein